MPPFIQPQFLKTTLPPPPFKDKINLTKNDVSLQFLLARDMGKTYKVSFIVNINPRQALQPSQSLSPRNINMESLKKAILANVSSYDKQYMNLGSFSTRKAEFYLNTKKFLQDTASGMKVTTKFSRFSRTFVLKKEPPRMILQDMLRTQWESFVLRHFKEYLESQKKLAVHFRYLIPDSTRRKIRGRIRNMFDWEYDVQWNEVTAKLKSIWIMALLVSTGLASRKIREADLKNKASKELFASKVRKNLPKFNQQTFDKYMRSKGYPV